MHKCKCFYCKTEFDRDKEPWVQVNNVRYAHKSCAEKFQIKKSKADQEYEELINYIESLFGIGTVNAKIAKQIKDYRELYDYTYSGMLGTLIYWYEIRKAPLDKANGGIGIVPYVYDQAKEYYTKINEANCANEGIKDYKAKVIEISITPPQPEVRKPHLFILEEEEN